MAAKLKGVTLLASLQAQSGRVECQNKNYKKHIYKDYKRQLNGTNSDGLSEFCIPMLSMYMKMPKKKVFNFYAFSTHREYYKNTSIRFHYK